MNDNICDSFFKLIRSCILHHQYVGQCVKRIGPIFWFPELYCLWDIYSRLLWCHPRHCHLEEPYLIHLHSCFLSYDSHLFSIWKGIHSVYHMPNDISICGCQYLLHPNHKTFPKHYLMYHIIYTWPRTCF